MKCARLQLQDRFKTKIKPEAPVSAAVEHPRRYCQRRMVNPEHEEDPRWTDVYERYHCNTDNNSQSNHHDSTRKTPDNSDLCLTVQTLKFQGDVDQTKKCRTNFKYKTPTDGAKHRMFVKQVVDNEYSDEDRTSQLTCYYYDDYVKYLFNNDKSRPNSGKSSIFLQGLSNKRENKATQVDTEQTANALSQKYKLKGFSLRNKQEVRDESLCDDTDDTKIAYRKSGKRKSLTISRTQSPETVHVIRVDVVCNNSGSANHADNHDNKLDYESQIESLQKERSYFADKYLLTSTIKKLDENLSGAKVTLLCKTFRLTERAKKSTNNRAKTNTTDENFTTAKDMKKSAHKNSNSKCRKQIHFS